MEWKVVTSVNVLAGLFGIRTQQKVFYVGRHSASSSNLPILYPSDPDHYLSPEATATYVGNNKTTHEVFKGFVPDLRKADGEAAQLSDDKMADSAPRKTRGFLVCDVHSTQYCSAHRSTIPPINGKALSFTLSI